ncbi:phosducin-like protein [Amyelois transitella]|uniref:phosducin-like protein n=1 Tax=Amyelois transitella TaxID=680683 RepID=UPI00067BDC6C|nr:phosducin-like protein [Amyelois transitella]
MATLEDKILGEKLHNYCSSSEDEGDSDYEDSRSGDEEGNAPKPEGSSADPPPVNSWNGTASNTGPKGVLEDWRRFQEMERAARREKEIESWELAKKLTLATRTAAEEEQAKEVEALEEEWKELLDEEYLMKYQQQRKQELMEKLQKLKKFGKVLTLNSKEEFLDAIDQEDPTVTVVVHIYNHSEEACQTMDGCLKILSQEHPAVKFCRIQADKTGLSRQFKVDGVPALLAYKGGDIIGNFVGLGKTLGEDFFATDVEGYLVSYGILPEKY